ESPPCGRRLGGWFSINVRRPRRELTGRGAPRSGDRPQSESPPCGRRLGGWFSINVRRPARRLTGFLVAPADAGGEGGGSSPGFLVAPANAGAQGAGRSPGFPPARERRFIGPVRAMSQTARIDAFLQLGREQNASDIHLAVGMPPALRMHGEIQHVRYRDLTAD